MADEILTLQGVNKRFGAVIALQGVTAIIRRGELVTFLGPSGCGKTTLLRIVGGFVAADAGDIFLDGDRINDRPPHRRDTAMVFQNYALFPHLTVFDNVAYGLRARGWGAGEVRQRVAELLRMVQLEGLEARRPHQLSGGQQQRVALARALSVRPKVLLLDEPLSNLDAGLRVAMREELRRLQRALTLTVILVTHDQEEAMSLSDRVAVLRAGSLEQFGAPLEIYEAPVNGFVAGFLGRVNLLSGIVRAGPDGGGLLLATPIGPLPLRAAPAFAPGERACAVLRPERITLRPGAADRVANALRGVVAEATYTGQVVHYNVKVGEGHLKVDVWDPRGRGQLPDGAPVIVELPTDLHLLPEAKA